MELAKIEVDTFGGSPFAKHNYPCPVRQTEHAVLDLSRGVFLPSWSAQKDGWRLVRLKGWHICLLELLGVEF